MNLPITEVADICRYHAARLVNMADAISSASAAERWEVAGCRAVDAKNEVQILAGYLSKMIPIPKPPTIRAK